MAEFKIDITRAVKDTAERALDEYEYKGHTIRDWADKITSGEYQPVIYARWENEHYNSWLKCWVANCSNCTEQTTAPFENIASTFCQWCGARMDGDSE